MNPPLIDLTGRRILVIGGGQGMGEATCLMAARVGASVAVLDREASPATHVAEAVEASGGKAVAITADVLNDEDLAEGIRTAHDRLGGLDGLVTIVGRAIWSPLLEMTRDEWQLTQDINLRYVFVAAQRFAQSLVTDGHGGSIVHVASVDGIRSAPEHAGYGAAKAGLLDLTRSAAIEWAAHAIRVNAVAPGAIVSPRIPLRSASDEHALMSRVPLAHRGSADDIAGGVVYLLSDLARYVTGHTLVIDGGLLAVGPLEYGDERSRLGAHR
ncbi:SDR family NAD(P)-dependent oxidoreductase [Microbacterium sp.]|uniref:SDR family NAD(P)-dependent oxidoreductase n=1 Tax=Microbacterium sp. TaxID=51671 RepID=UPI002B6BB5B1|nr:SDR family NAD(P)-dependent oxidoreductase [Microbacterium sp.]HWL78017.1 SDR family NAD(P)-dependent oxidoreductase [Microbacterium sp.]